MAGPIKGILKANLFLCFPYHGTDTSPIIEALSKCVFSGFSLLKTDPRFQARIRPETELTKYLEENPEKKPVRRYVLGTLGWNEFVVLTLGECINDLFEDFFSVSGTVLIDRRVWPLFVKTYSFIGLNYDTLPSLEETPVDFDFLHSILNEISALQEKLPTSYPPIIQISCEPIHTRDIVNFWVSKQFEIQTVLGKDDISLTPPKDISWSFFLTSLLFFRQEFRGRVLSTKTFIRGQQHDGPNDGPPLSLAKLSCKTFFVRNSFKALSRTFGPYAYSLANDFFALNSLTQNPIIGSAFEDMAAYPKYIEETGKELKQKSRSNLDDRELLVFAMNCSRVLRSGAELRLYGTHGGIEEVAGKFSRIRGGAQRALIGMEFLPSYVLEELGGKWDGFIVTEDPSFFHVNEVIIVPTDSLWKPQTWWALYHETAHVLIHNLGNQIDLENDTEIQQFLSKKRVHFSWIDLLNEMLAEVIGYKMGFFGNYELFIRVFWNYLIKIHPVLRTAPLESYIIRTAFVGLFQECFRPGGRIRREQFEDDDFLYDYVLRHITLIGNKTRSKKLTHIYKDRFFISAEVARNLKNSYPVAEYFHNIIKSLPPLQDDPSALSTPNTKEVITSLMGGRIWWDDLDSPRAVLYHIFKGKEELSFAQSIATVLTFWNLQSMRKADK